MLVFLKVVACAELFDEFDSIVLVDTVTLFTSAHEVLGVLLTVPLIVIEADAPPASVPRLQVTVCPDAEHVPLPLGFVFVQLLETKLTPLGSVSVATTLCAAVDGSRFVTVT